MNYKCRFCGYRFKDKDEQICPECFTAREEDISCGAFSEDDHSHYFSVSDLEREESFFSKNDTFKEERNDFLEDERRNEKRTAAARYERNEQRQFERQSNIPRQTNIPTQTSSALPKQNVYSRRPYDPNQRVSITNYNLNRPPQQNSQQKPKKASGCGCFLTLCIMSIMFSVIGSIASNIGIEKNNSSEKNTASQSEPTAPGTKKTHGRTPAEQTESDTGVFEFPAQTSEDRSYYVKVSDFTVSDTGVLELSEDECRKFSIFNRDNGNAVNSYNNDMDLELTKADFTIELYKSDLENNTNRVEYMSTFSKEKGKDIYYEYFIPDYDDTLIINSYVNGSDGATASQKVKGSIYYKPDTEYIQFIVGITDGIDQEQFIFELN